MNYTLSISIRQNGCVHDAECYAETVDGVTTITRVDDLECTYLSREVNRTEERTLERIKNALVERANVALKYLDRIVSGATTGKSIKLASVDDGCAWGDLFLDVD